MTPLHSAWALAPLAPRILPAESAVQRIRLVGPEAELRSAAEACGRLGGWASPVEQARPPLNDRHQVVVSGTVAQLRNLAAGLPGQLGRALGGTLDAVLAPLPVLTLGGHRFDFGAHVYVAGILNNTPDSFYDRGRDYGRDAALARAEAIVRDGADLIEIGGETAQEGEAVAARDEIDRVAPLVAAIVQRFALPVAVDTYKPDVAKAAIDAGAVLINDISGAADPAMAGVIAGSQAGLVVMYLHGRPKQHYVDVPVPSMMDWVAAFLARRTGDLMAAGVPRDRILVDPGLNFGKRPSRDIELMQRLPELRSLSFPIFVATSRKDYIRDLLRLHPDDLLEGTAAAVAFAIAQGANMLRVHDVQAMVRVARMMEFFCGHQDPQGRGDADARERRAAAVAGNASRPKREVR